MYKHIRYEYVKKVISSGLNVLLTGPAGSGKTTLIQQVAEELGQEFSFMSMTKQTSVNAIIGFKSINGTYIPSLFREAYENGHIFLLDEIDAADSNVLLCLNTIENGYMSFPDGIIKAHPDFKLVATANPQDEHSIYTGRSKLDFSTLDRFFTVQVPADVDLEMKLTSELVAEQAKGVRGVIANAGRDPESTLTMRDILRAHSLRKANIDKNPIATVLFNKHPALKELIETQVNDIIDEVSENYGFDGRLEQTVEECKSKPIESYMDYESKIIAEELLKKKREKKANGNTDNK